MDKETPITKYLAALERRQALLYDTPPPADINKKLNFDDDSFFKGHCSSHEQSLLHISPPVSSKRKRSSIHDYHNDEELHKKSSELERLLRQTQAELIDSRALITKLEHQIMEIKKQHMEKIISVEKSNSEILSKSKNAIEHADRLEHQLMQATKKDGELQEKVKQQAEAHNVKFRVMEDRLTKLQRENVELRGKLNNANVRSQDIIRKITYDLSETEKGAEKWIMETQLLKEQLDLKDQQLKKYQQEQLSVKLKEVQALAGNSDEPQAKAAEAESQIKSLEERVKKYENLFCKQQNDNINLTKSMKKIQEENTVLRTTMRSEMVLKEQIASLEGQLKSAHNELRRQLSVESENANVNDELNKWKTIASKIDTSCNNPIEFEAFIRKIQNLLLELKHENSDLLHKNENSSRLIVKFQAEAMSLREQIKNSKEEKDKLALDMKKLTRRMGLIAKDRDGLKGLKESYEQEFTGLISSPLQERISQLESVLAEYEVLLKEDVNIKKACNECENRMALVNQLRSDLENKKRELSDCRAQQASIQPQSSTDDVTEGIKIVAFNMNPSALTVEARIKELNSENERLKEKLKSYEDESTMNIADPSWREEKKKLEDQYKVLERKHQILTEAYEYETQMLNVAITRLFGFHITLVQEPIRQIRLQSIYSHSTNTEDAFIFQEAENQDMMLLETPILNSFRDDIDRFLIGMNSIPAFVACITITYVQSSSQPSYDDMSLIPLSQDSQPSQPRGGIVDVLVQNTNDEDDEDEDEDDLGEEEEQMYEDEEESDHNVDYDQQEDEDDDVVTIDDD